MDHIAAADIITHFSILEDPRMERNTLHNLIDIIILTVCAVISGAETWEEVANGMLMGQKKTSDHSNEITAIPALLEMLKIKGCIVTIDAMGCQEAIAKKIRTKKADSVFILKLKRFAGARSIGMVRVRRIIGRKETTESRYYISSLPMNAKEVRPCRAVPLDDRELTALDVGCCLS